MTRHLVRFLIGAILVIAVPVAVPTPAAGQTYSSRCPVMTDSITRLYYAFFDRGPDKAGFDQWVSQYQSGQMSLEEIAQAFAQSREFTDRGLTSNQSFVKWIYRVTLEREPTEADLDHWVTNLERNYPRGSMALALTERAEYVARTNTAKPLAGFLKWYPKGTHWYCDIGAASINVQPLVNEVWADYYFMNRSDQTDTIELWTTDAGARQVRMAGGNLSAGFIDYNWDGVFRGDGDYGRGLSVQVGPTTDWVVVFYPSSIGADRFGWQIS